jgi:type IV secretion system protein VirB10
MFNDEEQNINEPDDNSIPVEHKGPNLLKNRKQVNNPPPAVSQEDNDIPSDNLENNSDDENNNSFVNRSDFLPDENDIPSQPDDPDDYESYEDYSSCSSSLDDDSDDSVVSDIETEPSDIPPEFPSTAGETEPDNSEPYTPPDKVSPNSVMGKMKPLKLNRQLILFTILGFFCVSFLFVTFIMPALQQKKITEAAQKKKLEQSNLTDYSLFAQQKKSSNDYDSYNYSEDTGLHDVVIPEPFEYYQQQPYVQQQQQQTFSSGSGGSSQYPDTRNDRLQGKSISGIKGLSSSRQNYATPNQTGLFSSVSGALSDNSNNPYAQFGMPPKDDYMQSMLSQYGGPQSGNNSYASQNNQNDKINFMNQNRINSGSGHWLPVNSVWQGTIFEATLTSNINTDLPGECTAWVTKNVYSSLDGQFLLIPQNSRLFGSYNSSISYSQSRVQIGWHTLIRPDGYVINLGNMQATDPQGAAGLKGFVNDHPFAYLKALGLITALNLTNAQFNSTIADSQNQYVQNILADTQQMTNRLADKILDRALDIQPTIVINSGTKINIVVNQSLVLPPLTPYGVTNPYHKGE